MLWARPALQHLLWSLLAHLGSSPSVPVCVSAPPSPLASALREQQNMAEPLLEKTNFVPSPCCSSLSPAVSAVTLPEVTLHPLCHSPEADRTEATGVLLITQRPWFSLVHTSQSRRLVQTSSLCPGQERDDQSRPEKDRLPQASLPCPPGAPRVWTGRKPSLCPRAWALLHAVSGSRAPAPAGEATARPPRWSGDPCCPPRATLSPMTTDVVMAAFTWPP